MTKSPRIEQVSEMASSTIDGNNRNSSNNGRNMRARVISSSVGSIVTSLVINPLEVVKVRLQNEVTTTPSSSSRPVSAPSSWKPARPSGALPHLPSSMAGACCECGALAPPCGWRTRGPAASWVSSLVMQATTTTTTTASANTSTTAMLRRVFVQEGLSGLYKGIGPALLMAVPNTVLYFTSYEEILRYLQQQQKQQQQQQQSWQVLPPSATFPLLAGGAARLVASTATAPLEYIRTLQAAQISTGATSPLSLARSSVVPHLRHWISSSATAATATPSFRLPPVHHLFHGLSATLWRDVPFSAIYWVCVETMREQWRQHAGGDPTAAPRSRTLLFVQSFVNGATAGMIAACATTPADVVKTRVQSGAVVNGGTSSSSSSSTLALVREIVATEGWAGLWKGNNARVLKVAPACAIMISSYEVGQTFL